MNLALGNDNPVLTSLAEVSSAAFVGAGVGKVVDMFRDREDSSASTAGALIGVIVGALAQLRKLSRG